MKIKDLVPAPYIKGMVSLDKEDVLMIPLHRLDVSARPLESFYF
jgi:hypothetical protein